MCVSVVIVNYNAGQAILECIESIYDQSFEDSVEIIVVDNGSNDGSIDAITKRWSEIRVMRNGQNLGFGKAANIGIKNTTFNNILLANPDTKLAKNTLQELYSFLISNDKVWLCTCKIMNDDGSLKPSYSGEPSRLHSFLVATGLTSVIRGLQVTSRFLKFIGMSQFYFIARRQERDDIFEVPVSLGALMFFKKDRIAKVDFFTEDYFMYWEDVDLCLKIRKAGGKIFYNGKTSVAHQGGTFESGISSRQAVRLMVTHYYKSERLFWQNNLDIAAARKTILLLKIGLYIRRFLHMILPTRHKLLIPLPE